MPKYNIVVIGGGPAGVTAAIAAKNHYPHKTVILVRKEEKPMVPCGIPYIFNSLDKIEHNILPDAILKNNNIEILIGEMISRNEKEIILADDTKIEFEKLVIAVGSKPVAPIIEGIKKNGIFQIKKDLDYLIKLKNKIKTAKNIVIVGGGYIGIEIADELSKRIKKKENENIVDSFLPSLESENNGLLNGEISSKKNNIIETITIVEQEKTLLSTMDHEFGTEVEQLLNEEGVNIISGKSVQKFKGNENVRTVVLDDNSMLETDLVIITCGYQPNSDYAEYFGVDENKGIIVDEFFRTSDADVFAVGDCIQKLDRFNGNQSNIMLASTAAVEGRIAGANLYMTNIPFKNTGVLGTFSTKINNRVFAITGLTEKIANAQNLNIIVGYAKAIDKHPGKLSNSSPQVVKLIFSKLNHELVGAQVSGGDSVGELINMLTVMIANQNSVFDIFTLQIGTHPLLTASPITYPVINAATDAIKKHAKIKNELLSLN